MADDWSTPNQAVNALGSILGYIGAEAMTEVIFTKLFWPQRAYSHYRLRHLLQLGLFCPAGGPLYKAALGMLDIASKNGLFRGRSQGQMLGTAFFPDSRCDYTLKSTDPAWASHSEGSRNNIWARVVAYLRFPDTAWRPHDEKQAHFVSDMLVRARVVVCHLTLTVEPIPKDCSRAQGPNLEHENDIFSVSAILGILTTELTGIFFAGLVAIVWKSYFAILWLLPLILKLLSLSAAMKRQPLDLSSAAMLHGTPQSFVVHLPAETGTFLAITGPPALVLQFFRHYGHPVRNRFREVVQLSVAIIMGLLFPIGLICSLTGMPLPVQYLWISYQIYVVGVMYVARFLNVEKWASIEELIAERLIKDQGRSTTRLWEDRACGRFVGCVLETSFYHRYSEGRSHVESLQRI